MPPASHPSPRPALTRERIVASALALADSVGSDKLSMRALAGALGVEAMSLYHHLRNKDDLLDALVEAVVAEIERPRIGPDWRDEMRRRALSMRRVFLAHPWAPPLIVGRIHTGPGTLALIDATLGCLAHAGFDPQEADHVMNAIDSYVYGFHLLERSFPLAPEGYAEAARGFLPGLDEQRYPHFAALGRRVAAGEYDGINHLEFGLDHLLRGLAAGRQHRVDAAASGQERSSGLGHE